MNDMPVRNWQLETDEWAADAQKITGPAMQEQWPPKQDTCYACPIACKWEVKAPGPTGEETRLAGPEYESLTGLGAQAQNSDPLAIIQAADLWQPLGARYDQCWGHHRLGH